MSSHARLVVEGRGQWVYTHVLGDTDKVTIGRGQENDIDVGDLHASSHHAEIIRDGDDYILKDMGSRNGTYVKGKKVTADVKLRNGDDIRIGKTTMSFLTDKDPSLGGAGQTQTRPGLSTGSISNPGAALEPAMERLDDLRKNIQSGGSSDSGLLGQAVEDLQEELRNARAEIEALSVVNEFGQVLSRKELTAAQLFSEALYFMAERVHAENGFLMQIDMQKKKWAIRCRYGDIRDWVAPQEGGSGQKLPLSLTLVEKAIKSGEPVLSQSALDDPRFVEAKSIGFLGIQSCMCHPIKDGDDSMGVVYVDRRNSPEAFNKFDEKLFAGLTNYLSSLLYPPKGS